MKVGEIVNAKIEKIFPTYVIARTNNYQGLLHVASVSDYYVPSLWAIFKVGEEYDFEIIEIDEERKWLKLGWKTIVPRFQKNPFEYVIKETQNGFENLRVKAHKEEEND